MISVYLVGPRNHIQPLAYSALAALFKPSIDLVDSPDRADILLFSHPDDLQDAGATALQKIRKSPNTRVVLLSEEPFWDTVGPLPPFERQQVLPTPLGELPYTYLNHHTSKIFDFQHIPYFLLTDHRFFPCYSLRFARNARRSLAEWQAHFATVPMQAGFLAEHRLYGADVVPYPPHDVHSICTYRTRLTEHYATGRVLRAGRGWPDGSDNRIELQNWHLDKLMSHEGKYRFFSALENTHQWNYLTEKFFDAFAIGAVPLYYASQSHAAHRIVVPGSWVNLYDLSVAEAVAAIDEFQIDAAFLEHYMETQSKLARLFGTPKYFVVERARLQREISAALETVLGEPIA